MTSKLDRLLELAGKLSSHYTQELFSEYNSLRKEIEAKIEKAEKHDELINGRYGILELNEKISNLHQDNEKLKEEVRQYAHQSSGLYREIQTLKEYKISWKKAEESYIYMHINDYKEIQSLKSQLDKINNFVGHITLEELLVELEQYKSVIDEIRKLKFHDMPIPRDSTSFAQFSKKQSKLKSILKEAEKE